MRRDDAADATKPAVVLPARSSGRLVVDESRVWWVVDHGRFGPSELRVAPRRAFADGALSSGTLFATLPTGVTAELAADATTIYLARDGSEAPCADPDRYPDPAQCPKQQAYDGELLALPKSGGPPRTLHAGFGAASSLVLDGANVYLALSNGSLVAVPLSGGPATGVLGQGQSYGFGLAVDARFLHVFDDETLSFAKLGRENAPPSARSPYSGHLTAEPDGHLLGFARSHTDCHTLPEPVNESGGYYQIKGPPDVRCRRTDAIVDVDPQRSATEVLFTVAVDEGVAPWARPLGPAVAIGDDVFFDDGSSVRWFRRGAATTRQLAPVRVQGLASDGVRVFLMRDGRVSAVRVTRP